MEFIFLSDFSWSAVNNIYSKTRTVYQKKCIDRFNVQQWVSSGSKKKCDFIQALEKHGSLYLAPKYLSYNLWDLVENKGYALGYGYLHYCLFLNQITCKMYLWCLQKCSCFRNK